MSQKVKWGVIGSGGIARRRTIPEGILPAVNAELRVVYDLDQKANQAVADQYAARPAASVAELLEAGIDAVYIATPPSVHCEHTVAVARAGKHVLCEKPLGMTVAEAVRMLAECREHRVLLGTAFMMRFHAQHQAALELVRAGKLGKLVFGRAQLSCWYPPLPGAWRQDPLAGGGGALMDMGGHCIDLLEMFFGRPRAVSCLIHQTVHAYAAEDSAVATLFFENGALAVVDAFFCVPDAASRNALELYGSEGSILAANTIGQGSLGEMTAYLNEQSAGYDAHQARAATGGRSIQPAPVNIYRAEIEEFGQAILDHREPSHNAAIGVRSQEVLAACYESARAGRVVRIG